MCIFPPAAALVSLFLCLYWNRAALFDTFGRCIVQLTKPKLCRHLCQNEEDIRNRILIFFSLQVNGPVLLLYNLPEKSLWKFHVEVVLVYNALDNAMASSIWKTVTITRISPWCSKLDIRLCDVVPPRFCVALPILSFLTSALETLCCN